MGEKLATVFAFAIVAGLLGLNVWELGKDAGRKEAIAAMKCPGTYSLIDNRTGKCAIVTKSRRG